MNRNYGSRLHCIKHALHRIRGRSMKIIILTKPRRNFSLSYKIIYYLF